MRGVDAYQAVSGAQVELPTGYQQAWGNALGEYILSNDPFFDPNQVSSQTWTQLHRQERSGIQLTKLSLQLQNDLELPCNAIRPAIYLIPYQSPPLKSLIKICRSSLSAMPRPRSSAS